MTSQQRRTLLAALIGSCFCLWVTGVFPVAHANAEARWELVVVREPARLAAEAKAAQVWIRELRADNRKLSRADVELIGSWRPEAADSYLLAVCEHAASDTHMAVRAATLDLLVLQHAWSGRLDVYRDGSLADSLPLTSQSADFVWHAAGRDVAWGASAMLLACLGVAFTCCRPWRGGPWLTAWLVVLAAGVHGVCWLTYGTGVTSDSPGYPLSLQHCLAGRPAYFPPGYGALLWLTSGFGTLPSPAPIFVQHAAIVALAAALHVRFRGWCGEACAFLAALAGAVAYPTLFGAQAVMSETWTCVLLAVPVLLVFAPCGRQRFGIGLAAGLVAGLAAWTRVVPLAASIPVFLVAGLLPFGLRNWRWVACSAGVAMAMVLVVLASNGLRSGQWQVSSGMGGHLFNHFVHQQQLLDPAGPHTNAALATTGRTDLRDLPHWEAGALLRRSAPSIDVDRVLLHIALEAARTVGLLEHVVFTTLLAWRNTSQSAVTTMAVALSPQPTELDFVHEPLVPGVAPGALLQQRSAAVCDAAWPAIAVLSLLSSLASLLLRERRGEWLAWVWTVWSYMFASSAVEYELPRYHVAVAPILVMLAVSTVGVLVRRSCGALRGEAARPAVRVSSA